MTKCLIRHRYHLLSSGREQPNFVVSQVPGFNWLNDSFTCKAILAKRCARVCAAWPDSWGWSLAGMSCSAPFLQQGIGNPNRGLTCYMEFVCSRLMRIRFGGIVLGVQATHIAIGCFHSQKLWTWSTGAPCSPSFSATQGLRSAISSRPRWNVGG